MDYNYTELRTRLQTLTYLGRLSIVRHEMVSSLAVIKACTDIIRMTDFSANPNLTINCKFLLDATKRAEHQLNTLLDRDSFYATYGHLPTNEQITVLCREMQTPLSMIGGSANTLADLTVAAGMSEDFTQFLELLARGARHLRNLIDILTESLITHPETDIAQVGQEPQRAFNA